MFDRVEKWRDAQPSSGRAVKPVDEPNSIEAFEVAQTFDVGAEDLDGPQRILARYG